MSGALPELYFRIKDNGAQVFRVETDNRQKRLDLDQIATVNVNKGEIKPQNHRDLTEAETAAINAWIEERRAVLAARDIDDIHRAIDHMNRTAQWAQTRATDAQLDDVTDKLLLAMYDLRAVLVRKKAERRGD